MSQSAVAGSLALMLPLGLISAFSPEGRGGDVWGVWFSVTLMFWGLALPMTAAPTAATAAAPPAPPRRTSCRQSPFTPGT
ncbi:hypothetical protein [Nocardiopsis coralliicola]